MSTLTLSQVLARQLEPMLAMLRASVEDCSEEVWLAHDGNEPAWEHAFHATVWLDVWIRTPDQAFVPPPFMCEAALGLKPEAGPPVPREAMRQYVAQVGDKCRALLARATDESLLTEVQINGGRYTLAEQVVGQFKHVQHHVACISAILRRHTGKGIAWVGV